MTAPDPLRAVTVRAADPAAPEIADYVAGHPQATPFHRPEWSIAVAEGCGQRAHCLVAEDAGGVAGVLPLTEVHSPVFGRALVSVGFAVDGGILAGTPRAGRLLAEAAWRLAERLSCPTLELRGGTLPAGDGWRRNDATYLGFARPLADNAEAELLAIPRKQRAEVRRALGNGMTVEVGSGARDRAAHHAVYAESVHALGTPVFPRALFDGVLDRFGADADILTVRKDGVPVASVLSLYHRGTVYPYWGGGTAAARGLRANDLMYFELMAHARGRGCTAFDFGRSKAGTGAAAFKKNWGFEPRPLAYARRVAEGAAGRDVNPLSAGNRLKVAAWKRLPLTVANRLGPLLARGIG